MELIYLKQLEIDHTSNLSSTGTGFIILDQVIDQGTFSLWALVTSCIEWTIKSNSKNSCKN